MRPSVKQSLSQNISRSVFAALTVTFFATLTATRPALAQSYSVVHNFCDAIKCPDGAEPSAGLIRDSAGNLYGVAAGGGSPNEKGVVFKLTPSGSETILYAFGAIPNDGSDPEGQLIRDAQGNLYGTTAMGGANNTSGQGDGIVYKLSPDGTETILYNFGASSTDGTQPRWGVVMDAAGNLFGTTYAGGAYGFGTIFRITPQGGETVLHSFAGDITDGGGPFAALIKDSSGNLYGTTQFGGTGSGNPFGGGGTVFEYSASGSYSILHNFAGPPSDGTQPSASLTLDGQGNLYGTAHSGGSNGEGNVFKLSPGSNGSWNETIVHNFNVVNQGQNPYAGVVLDPAGNLYGTTFVGGAYGYGCLYKITPAGKLSVLHAFGAYPDGQMPFANLLFSRGKLYGVALYGGSHSGGTVFEYTP
jgi:uncharacterized repeat protein (TIGR03803 family)